MNTASWIPDEFMRRVQNEQDWYFFDPKDAELHDLFGQEFDYAYRQLAQNASQRALEKNVKGFI